VPRVGQNKPPKWTTSECQNHTNGTFRNLGKRQSRSRGVLDLLLGRLTLGVYSPFGGGKRRGCTHRKANKWSVCLPADGSCHCFKGSRDVTLRWLWVGTKPQLVDAAVTQGKPPGKVRTIAAIFTHTHNVRSKWQVCMLAHQLGFPLPIEVTSGIWNWEKLWKECGASRSPGYS
jgi:hypothetical protein